MSSIIFSFWGAIFSPNSATATGGRQASSWKVRLNEFLEFIFNELPFTKSLTSAALHRYSPNESLPSRMSLVPQRKQTPGLSRSTLLSFSRSGANRTSQSSSFPRPQPKRYEYPAAVWSRPGFLLRTCFCMPRVGEAKRRPQNYPLGVAPDRGHSTPCCPVSRCARN
jgi:hypothetical protein